MNRKRKADDDREGSNKRRKHTRGRGGHHTTSELHIEGGSRSGRERKPQIEEEDATMNDDADKDKTHVYEDDEAATMAKKIRGKKWRDQKRRLGLEEDEEDSDASDEEGEGPALGQLGEEGDTVAELGPNMMPFNVREELEGGDFDRGIGAVRRKEEQQREHKKRRLERGVVDQSEESADSEDEDAGDRAWYEEQEARARDDKHYYARIGRNSAVVDDEESAAEEFDALQARKHLVQQLNYGENVFAAMRRLKPANDKRNKKEREADPTVQRFNALVESADQLMNNGFPNIYNDSRERIIESIERDENKASSRGVRRVSNVSNGGAEQYEYKWGPHETEVYGPYSLNDLQAWLSQGHFSSDVVARVANSENEFVPVSQLTNQ